MPLDESVINENGEIWAVDPRDLGAKLDRYYGVEGLRLMGDFYHEERGEMCYDVLAWFDGDAYRLVVEDVPMYGHGPSGAVGVKPEDLPPAERVDAVAEVDAA